MKKLVILFLCLVSSPLFAEAPPLIPRAALFSNAKQDFAQISPDGLRIAYLAPTEKGVSNLWVKTIGKEDAKVVTQDEWQGIYGYKWCWDNKRLLYMQDTNGDENTHVKSVDLETNLVRDLTPYVGKKALNLITDKNHPNELLVGLNLRDPKLFDMYRVDLTSGAITLDTQNPGDVLSWTTDANFQIRGATAFRADDLSTAIRVRDSKDAPWRDLLVTPFEKTSFPGQVNGGTLCYGFSKDGKSMYAVSSAQSDTTQLVRLDVATGKVLEVLASDPKADLWEHLDAGFGDVVYEVILDPDTYKMESAAFQYYKPVYKAIDPSVTQDYEFLAKNGTQTFEIINRDASGSKWMVLYRSDKAPDTYSLYDRKARKLELLFDTNPELSKYAMQPRVDELIPARDGMQLVSYLTLPAGVEPKNLPMVLLVHGGPWYRDDYYFDQYGQWLANRGYAVLQVNFRGSTGFGLKYLNAGTGQWGVGAMQNDLSDAVKWAESQGIADPKRVSIVGGSYGGYATLSGITFTPDLYACAVDIVGPSDVAFLLESFPSYWKPVKKRWLRRIGFKGEGDEEANKRISPLYHVENIKAPLLIGHGANDPRVNIKASDSIVKAMRDKNLPVTYIVYPDEGHGFGRPENNLDFNGRMEEFLGKCLGGRVEPWTKIEGSTAEVK